MSRFGLPSAVRPRPSAPWQPEQIRPVAECEIVVGYARIETVGDRHIDAGHLGLQTQHDAIRQVAGVQRRRLAGLAGRRAAQQAAGDDAGILVAVGERVVGVDVAGDAERDAVGFNREGLRGVGDAETGTEEQQGDAATRRDTEIALHFGVLP